MLKPTVNPTPPKEALDPPKDAPDPSPQGGWGGFGGLGVPFGEKYGFRGLSFCLPCGHTGTSTHSWYPPHTRSGARPVDIWAPTCSSVFFYRLKYWFWLHNYRRYKNEAGPRMAADTHLTPPVASALNSSTTDLKCAVGRCQTQSSHEFTTV